MSAPLPDERDVTFEYAPLLDRARRSDRDGFARLYDATYRRVFGYLLARVGEQPAAEDLLQDVYLAALQAVTRFRGRTEAEFVSWLLKIAHAKVIDRLRSQYRHPEVKTGDLPSAGRVDPLDAIDRRVELREIAAALSKLTDEQKEVVVNRLVLGLDLEETSKVMRKNVGSVKALQHRALARLARILTPGGTPHA
jgi:RNA polymerase sigma-70 factor (ECF subfamily)